MRRRRNRPQRGWALKWDFGFLTIARQDRPRNLSGYVDAVFQDRASAREYAKRYSDSFIGRPRVVPVTVTVREA